MQVLSIMVKGLPLAFMTTFIEYRFILKILGKKFSNTATFGILFFSYILLGQLNLSFNLATTISMNGFYYFAIRFCLYLMLFRGELVKKLFFAIFISYGIPITFYVLFPFVHYFFDIGSKNYLLCLQVLEYVNALSALVIMEFLGKKFLNLRRELPLDYTLFLSLVILFVHRGIFSSYDLMLLRNSGVITFSDTIYTSIFALLGNALVIISIFAVDRQVYSSLKMQLNLMQIANFKNQEHERARLSSFRHDFNNHLFCLSELLEGGKISQARFYISNLTTALENLDSPIKTGNDYADAIISTKYLEAISCDIKILVDMSIPPNYIEPIDLCSILGNAFDNAISACKEVTKEKRWITARSFVKQGQLVIEIKNTMPKGVTVIDNEIFPKKITPDHGIGLDTVRSLVKKYNGTLSLRGFEEFSFSVLLPHNRL